MKQIILMRGGREGHKEAGKERRGKQAGDRTRNGRIGKRDKSWREKHVEKKKRAGQSPWGCPAAPCPETDLAGQPT